MADGIRAAVWRVGNTLPAWRLPTRRRPPPSPWRLWPQPLPTRRPWPALLGGPCGAGPGAGLPPQSRGSTPGAGHAGVEAPPRPVLLLLLLLLLPRPRLTQSRRPGAAGRLPLRELLLPACSLSRTASTATRCSISRLPWVRVSDVAPCAQAPCCDAGTPPSPHATDASPSDDEARAALYNRACALTALARFDDAAEDVRKACVAGVGLAR